MVPRFHGGEESVDLAPIRAYAVSHKIARGDGSWIPAAGSTDPDGDPLAYTWELVNASGPEAILSSDSEVSPSFLAPDDATYLFRVTVDDGKGGSSSDEVAVTVGNSPPSVFTLVLPTDPTPVGISVTATAGFSDPGILDSHTAVWEWADGTSSEAVISEVGGQGTVFGDHIYNAAGVYTIRLTLADKDAASTTVEYRYLVIYDPAGGFVTAGGWLQTPFGSYPSDPSLTGKANFGLNARYSDGESIPTGQTQFNWHDGDLRFHSVAYEWLVIAGSLAQPRGTGTVNGEEGYEFLVTMIDGDVEGGDGVDKIRIAIRRAGPQEVIYDSQLGEPEDASPSTPLGGGSVVIHE